MDTADSDAYRDRVVDRLRALVGSHGLSVADVEKRLGHSRGYVNDALRGVKKLTVEMILEVLAAIDVPPEAFFERPMPAQTAYRPRRGRRPLRSPAPAPPGASSSPPGVPGASSPFARAMLLLLADRGLLGPEDLDEVRRELFSGEKPGGPEAAR